MTTARAAPPPAPSAPGRRRGPLARWPESRAALALGCLYLATMSGHLHSIDGLLMYRQAQALVYGPSLHFPTPIWWDFERTTSKYGLGASLLYLPGLALFGWLAPRVPTQAGPTYDLGLLYGDPLYALAGAPVHAVVTATSAWLVARLIRALGFGTGTALWGLALYGLGSPAVVYARGDWAQPLTGLYWILALLGAVHVRASADPPWLRLCAAAVFLGVLTRPVEGSLVVPAVLILLGVPAPGPDRWRTVRTVALAYLSGVAVTLLDNWARHGSPLATGYGADEGWTTPLSIGLPAALLSPGRGLLWQFPALLLVPVGLRALAAAGQARAGWTLLGLGVTQLASIATWHSWGGGWSWGLRLFVPALPVVAILAATGITALPGRARAWVPGVLLLAGVVWAVPCVVTDLLGGYAAMVSSAPVYALRGYPPLGAWAFLERWLPSGPTDGGTVDVLWVRLAPATGFASLLVPAALLGGAGALAAAAWREAVMPGPEARMERGATRRP